MLQYKRKLTVKKKKILWGATPHNTTDKSISSSPSRTQTCACTNTNTHSLWHKYPCSKCCSSHDIQETPKLPSFCLESITLVHHMTTSWCLFPLSDNNQLPLLTVKPNLWDLGSHCTDIQIITCRNSQKYVHVHCTHFKSQLFSIHWGILCPETINDEVHKRPPAEGFRFAMLLQPFITLWKEGGNHQKHMTHKEAYDCCIRLVVILAATSEYNLRLLITSLSTESAERMNNIICYSVTMNMVSHFTVWLNWMGMVT